MFSNLNENDSFLKKSMINMEKSLMKIIREKNKEIINLQKKNYIFSQNKNNHTINYDFCYEIKIIDQNGKWPVEFSEEFTLFQNVNELNLYAIVSLIGNVKCGKTFILNKFLSNSENKNNLVENRKSTIKIKYAQKAVFIDTKGFNIPDKPIIKNSQNISDKKDTNEKIEKFLLNYIKDQSHIIIYVLNAPTKYDFQIIEELKQISKEKTIIIIHNLFYAQSSKEIKEYFNNELKMYFLNLEKVEFINKNLQEDEDIDENDNYLNTFYRDQNKLNHYIIGNDLSNDFKIKNHNWNVFNHIHNYIYKFGDSNIFDPVESMRLFYVKYISLSNDNKQKEISFDYHKKYFKINNK